MYLSEALVLTSSLICILGASIYIRDTFRGTTKPNRVSWTIWAIAPLIGTGAAISAGAEPWAIARVFLSGLLPLIVLFASLFNRESYWKSSLFDLLCGAASFSALIIWLLLNNPTMAILAAATGDGFASIPTLIKAWKAPQTESGTTFLLGLLSIVMTLPAIQVWDIPNAAFSIYLLVINLLLVVFIYRRKIFSPNSLRK